MRKPLNIDELLYIGVDIAKETSYAGFISNTLLAQYGKFEQCPAILFNQSREGYNILLKEIQQYVSLVQCLVVMEVTGHYHKSLEQFLIEHDIPVYLMGVQERPKGMTKTDKRDALGLANHLYNQQEKNIQVRDKNQLARLVMPDISSATQLKGLIQHRNELTRESTRRKNKLTAINDELFPEFRQVFKNPNLDVALRYRDKFPLPQDIANAPMEDLITVRVKSRRPFQRELVLLQELAEQSIGVKNLSRQEGLVFEQKVFIKELQFIQETIKQIDEKIAGLVAGCREGNILLSVPVIGTISAATLIASIGNIGNFPTAGHLQSYLGWAPIITQTGLTLDNTKHTNGGGRIGKSRMYMIACGAITRDTEWRKIYHRLVKRQCRYDERRKKYIGTRKVIGRVAGQMIKLIYMLLKTDQELVNSVPPNSPLPAPMLYDPLIHKSHREGQYKPQKRRQPIIQLSRT